MTIFFMLFNNGKVIPLQVLIIVWEHSTQLMLALVMVLLTICSALD